MWRVPHLDGSAPIGKRVSHATVNRFVGAFPIRYEIRYEAVLERRPLRHPAQQDRDQFRDEGLGVESTAEPVPHLFVLGMVEVA